MTCSLDRIYLYVFGAGRSGPFGTIVCWWDGMLDMHRSGYRLIMVGIDVGWDGREGIWR